MKLSTLFTFLIMVFSLPLLSQNSLLPATDCYYLKNANVISSPEDEGTNNSIIIRGGIIEDVGVNLVVPFDAKVLDMDSMYIYPGFIAPLSHAGIKESEEKKKKEDKPKSPGQATFTQAGITPQYSVTSSFDPKSKSIEGLRKAGFGIAHVIPKGYILSGQGAIFSLKSGTATDDLLIKQGSSMAMSLKTKRGVFPSTLIGAMSRLREIHQNTGNYITNMDSYLSDPTGKSRVKSSEVYHAMVPVYKKELPVYFHAEKPKHIHRAITLNDNFKYDMVLSDVKLVSPLLEIVSSEYPILLSLDLPKELKNEKTDEEDKEELTPEQRHLKQRKQESYDTYLSQAKVLDEKGYQFSFSYTDVKANDILKSIRRLVKAGLDEKSALEALTVQPAKMLGISKMAGTIEKGKIGNLVVFDKPLFEDKTTIRYVFVEGQMTEIEQKKNSEKKKSSGELGNISGAWRFTVDVPEDEQVGNLFFEQDGESYKVRLESDEDPGEFEDGENIKIEGNVMTFDMAIDNDGYIMNVSFDIKFEGEFLEGTVTVEEVGSFPIEAVKRAIPD